MVLSRDADFPSVAGFAPSSMAMGESLAGVAVEGIAPDSAESLRIRTELMLCLQQHIDQQQWSLQDACQVLRQPLPRMQNLLNGEIGRFSIEDLVELLTQLGLNVRFSVLSARPLNPPKLVKRGPDETPVYH